MVCGQHSFLGKTYFGLWRTRLPKRFVNRKLGRDACIGYVYHDVASANLSGTFKLPHAILWAIAFVARIAATAGRVMLFFV